MKEEMHWEIRGGMMGELGTDRLELRSEIKRICDDLERVTVAMLDYGADNPPYPPPSGDKERPAILDYDANNPSSGDEERSAEQVIDRGFRRMLIEKHSVLVGLADRISFWIEELKLPPADGGR